jgi:type III restriction enzyme
MELKGYQQQVLSDLELFLDYVQETKDSSTAFRNFWVNHPRMPLTPFPGTAIEPYKNNIPKVPNVCVKVPTAGGKTFIAANALKTIFDAFDYDRKKVVVWLVPSITILDQTINNFKDPSHPYRQKINSLFSHRVQVFSKSELLQGSGFNITSVSEQLNILILSFDSLRAKNKEERKVYQDNSNLSSFESMIAEDEDLTLMKVINTLNPVVVVDESHNAESELSIEMLKNLNPCFVLDLTATPRNNSNIISFVDALELKKDNMVKLPVIVYNHNDKTDVINSALQLQRKLELQAIEEHKKGGKYIRPIVLFQAQPKNAEDNTTFEKLKEKLIELKISADHIKIKTAEINELKNVDLLSPDCPVRYIITINALKEGWDCPFAYILASLADKSSAVDVEQILGRVLRQPYVSKHNFPLLNLSFVLTASSKFMDTLQNIVKGLNKAGFSEKDYRLAQTQIEDDKKKDESFSQLELTSQSEETTSDDILAGIDESRIVSLEDNASVTEIISSIESTAIQQNRDFEKIVSDFDSNNNISLPSELQPLVKTYSVKEIFKEQAASLEIPQFFIKEPISELFNTSSEILLEKESLLEDFELSKYDTNISFDSVTSELYKVDLDETKKEHTPTFVKLDGGIKEKVLAYIADPKHQHSRVKHFAKRILDLLGNLYPIPDSEIEKYLTRVFDGFNDEQFKDLVNNEYSYTRKIKDKIKSLSEDFAEKKFKEFLDTDHIFIKPSYKLPNQIIPGSTSKDITKSLYEKEASINPYEERIINEIANLQNIAFWTRNIEMKGFRINGFINHYPDFIIQTKSGKTVILETKGDHLDAESKIRLGNLWAGKAGNNYRYFMVYDKRVVEGAYKLDDFLNIIRML